MSRAHLQLAAAVAAIGILILPAAAGAAPRAAGAPTPVPGVDVLSSITCPTANACVPVGSDSTSVNGKSAVITAATGAVKVKS